MSLIKIRTNLHYLTHVTCNVKILHITGLIHTCTGIYCTYICTRIKRLPITKYVAILNRPVCNVFRLFNIVRMCPLLHKRCITYTKVSRCCFIICLYFISQCFDQGSSHCEHYQYHYVKVLYVFKVHLNA
jgi:hypothetical protein